MRLISLIFSLVIISSLLANAKEEYSKEWVKDEISRLQGASNVGTDFWISVPPAYIETFNANDAIKLFIVCPKETNVKISSLGFSQNVQTIPNGVVGVDLAPGIAQPYVFTYNQDPQESKVIDGKGLHIEADDPIVLYCVVRYQATSDGFLCLPTPALGTEYIATPYSSRPIAQSSLPNMVTVTAPYDNTKVDVTIGGNIITVIPVDGGPELGPGDDFSWNLDKGDVLVLTNKGNNQTLSGSLIKSDKPVAVISGHYCADIPVGNRACDYNAEMDLPVHVWGKHYHVPLVQNRVFPSIIRVFAKEDDTKVYRNGREISVIREGMGGMEGRGWQETRLWPRIENNGDIALISGDKPIYVMMYNQGVQEDQQAGSGNNSDPFSMLITPIEQYQTEITFATPGIAGGNPFAQSFLNVVYQADENGLAPEDLMWGTNPSPNGYDYQTLRQVGGVDGEFFFMANSEDDFINQSPFANNLYKHKPMEIPNIGVYNVKGSLPFAVYAYGYAFFDSYGFPTSSALKNLEIDDPFAPTANWEFGCETEFELTGRITEQPTEEENRISGIYSVNTIVNDNFEKIEIYDVTFDNGVILNQLFRSNLIDPTLPGELMWLVNDGAGNSSTFNEFYYPEEYEFYAEVGEPGERSFEYYNDGVAYPDGVVDTEYFIIENTSPNGELVIEDIFLKNKNQGMNFDFTPNSFELDGVLMDPQPTVPLDESITLGVGSELRFGVNFSSTDAKTTSRDSLGIETCTYDKLYSVGLQAEKGGPRINAIDPNPFPFTQIDQTAPQQDPKGPFTYEIRNRCPEGNGTTDLVIVGIQGPADPQFTTDIQAQLPLTIPAGEEAQFNVTFQSNGTAGDFTDRITFITEPNNLDECKDFIDLQASAGSTSLDAQAYEFAEIDLYNFVQGGQQAVMADNSQADDAPITIVNQATDDELVVDLNGGDVNLNSPESANNFYFDAAATNLVEIDQNFDQELTIANLRAGEKTTTRNVYFKPTTTGDFGITYKVTGDTDDGVQLETPEYQITGSAIVANLAIYKVAATEDASVVDFGTDVYPSALPNQTFEITNTRFDGIYTYGNDAVFTLDFDNNIGYGDADDVYIIDDVNYSDGRPYTGAQLDQADITLGAGETLVVSVRHNGEYNNGDVINASIRIADHNTLGNGADLPNTGPWNDVVSFTSQVTNITSIAGAANLPQTCVGNITTLDNGEFFIANNSGNPFNVIGLPILTPVDGNNTGFSLDIINVGLVNNAGVRTDLGLVDLNTTPQTLNPGERIVFDLEFAPTADIGLKAMEAEYFTDIIETDGVNTAPTVQDFDVETVSFQKDVVLRNISGNDNLKIGETLEVGIAINGGADISQAGLIEAQGTISYRRGYLVADYNSLALAPQYQANFELIYDANDITEQFLPRGTTGKDDWVRTLNFTVRSLDGTPINANGDVVTMSFNVLLGSLSLDELPEGKDESNIYIAQDRNDDFDVLIRGSLVPTGASGCATLNQPEDITVTLDEECAYEFRTIATTGSVNEDSRVSQNPVTSTGADLEFSLAMEGETSIKLYDTNGNLVSEILSEYLTDGAHKIEIPINDLPNGAYLYEIKSQFYSSTNKFVVSK